MTSPWLDDGGVELARHDSEADGPLGDIDLDWGNCEKEWEDCCAQYEAVREECETAQQRRRRTRQPVRQPPATGPLAQHETATAVRMLDLERKVQQDTYRSAIAAQNKRMGCRGVAQ
jgi:hypothetical protein